MTRSLLSLAFVAAMLAAGCDDNNPSSPTSVKSNTLGSTSTDGSQTSCSAPPTPGGLRVTGRVGTSVELTWNTVVGATSYTVLVGSVPGATNVLSADTVNASIRFTAPDGKSYARVQANSPCGGSPTSPSIEILIP